MSLSAHVAATPRGVSAARLAGYVVFLVAFFVPACRQPATPGMGSLDSYVGYFCAWVTLVNTFNGDLWRSKDFLAILSGWINPLMLLYVAFMFSSKLRVARRAIAVLVALFLVGTWVYFAMVPLTPLIGHFLWVAGILLILNGEVFQRGVRTAADSTVPPNP